MPGYIYVMPAILQKKKGKYLLPSALDVHAQGSDIKRVNLFPCGLRAAQEIIVAQNEVRPPNPQPQYVGIIA